MQFIVYYLARTIKPNPAIYEHCWINPIKVIVAEIEEMIVGVVWIQFEGNLPETLRNKIWGGYKRVRGHVLPQSLSAHLGLCRCYSHAFCSNYAYCHTSKFTQTWHRQPAFICAKTVCRQYQCQFIGAMYAADLEVTQFWLKNRFSPVRLGIKADTSSANDH